MMLAFILTFIGFAISDVILIALLTWILFRHFIHSLKFPVIGISELIASIIVMILNIIMIFTKFNLNKTAIILCVIIIFVYYRIEWAELCAEEIKAFENYKNKIQKSSFDEVKNMIGQGEKSNLRRDVSYTLGEEADDYALALENWDKATQLEDENLE